MTFPDVLMVFLNVIFYYSCQQFLILMQKAIFGRKKKQNLERVENMTPQKYGKAAFCDLTFTPSKLSENLLFKEANNMRRVQEQSSRCRELQSQNKFLSDQIQYLKRQRAGIESSLNKMIEMYKQIISNMQHKNEERLRGLQNKFTEQIKRHIASKQEQAKYIQSQKECLEQNILQLQAHIQTQKGTIQLLSKNKSEVVDQNIQYQQKIKTLTRKYDELELQYKEMNRHSTQIYEELRYKYEQAEINWKNNFNEEIRKKNLQIQRNAKVQKEQLQKKQSQKSKEMAVKHEEANQLKKKTELQINKTKEIVLMKEKIIQSMNQQANLVKAKILNITRQYQASISALVHQKNRYKEEINLLSIQCNDLKLNNEYTIDEYTLQMQKMNDLLQQNSMQLDKCRSELSSLAKDNQKLVTRVKSSEDEAKTWRESYYLSKTSRQS